MKEDIIELLGKESGPTSIILVGIHGNEKCGVYAMEKLLPSLEIERGRVFIGYGNPRAIEQDVRFTETNINRMFKSDELISEGDRNSYEYSRAQFLKKYLDQADALLDVHSSFTPGARPFIICEPNAKGIVEYLPMDLVVSGFDKWQPGGTDYYMNANGKIGICVECGYLGDSAATQMAEQSIIAFLTARGHIKGDSKIYQQSSAKVYSLYITKTDKFRLSKPFEDFEKILAGQIIGIDGDEEIKSPKDSFILFARDRNKIGDEAFLLGEIKSPA